MRKSSLDGIRQSIGCPCFEFAEDSFDLRPEFLNRVQIRAVRWRVKTVYAGFIQKFFDCLCMVRFHVIHVSLFGELSISTSKGVLKEADFNSPRISRLISYLLISRKNAISPQEITQTLWPDDSDNPAKNVKGLVYRLRQKFSIISDEPLVLSSADGEHWLIQFATKYHLSYMSAVSELLKQLDSLHSYDLLNQYAMKSLTIAPDNPKAYCWLIRSLKAQGMNELATNELAAAKEHLTTEEYEEILAFGVNW